ncbi:acyl-CoA synthetase [Aurantivibrio plasticivorans]
MNNPAFDEAVAERLTELGMGMAVLAATLGDTPAIITAEGTRSFNELNANANRVARLFREHGLQPDDGVAVLTGNSIEMMETLYACYRAGFRMTPINWHLTDDEIAYIVNNCEAKALVVDASRFGTAAITSVKESNHLALCLSTSGELQGFSDYNTKIKHYSGENIEDPVSGNIMLYTSGTTGRPKGVYRKKRPMASPLSEAINETSAFQPGVDVSLVTGPLYHSAPLSINLGLPLAKGVTCVFMDKWDAEETLRLIEKYKVTFSHMVPTMIQRILALPDDVKQQYDLSSFRYLIHGAAPCPVVVKQAAMEFFGPIIHEYYAATEGGYVFSTPQDWLAHPGTVGKPAQDAEIKILDDDKQPVPVGSDGTVYFVAPEDKETQFEYFRDSEKTAKTYVDNLFTMGDIGHVDEEGFLYLTGRSAELVICGGVNVYPAQIDEVLSRHSAIADVATFGVDNEEFGEEIKAVIELNEGEQPTEEIRDSITAFIQEKLQGFMRPRSIEFIDEVPRSAGGKIKRRQLREKFNGKH